ncbi:hypothetical protein ALX04_006530 [Lactiplantibacillus plantarum subsp. plantarum]|uniref:zinc-finger-containing protein n=1 Tax=Lactiplantibacillus plantarum TaxID=1590 RepID=UPI0006A6CE4E|nr:zinc-finger-containing protein [Lactiplantibacillus plantarum]ASI63341.1 hypothetical protein ALX04_006530 [Lactiplantibacillus plantarum subsp. plantarum]KAE9506694.1 hypothetical protein FET70_00093 [Lactiplantibacillus plantarum]KAE9508213.1 hypothetical protein FET70_01671 [Lactiplantibacillus plantarum]MCT3240064.1 hypothetical protein [Lactiplantibacillus plantarum]UOC07888.1 DUF3268 family zinc-finger domain-containing protein [Lactiplantibacillus plantarum]
MIEVKSLTRDPECWDKFPCPYCGGRVIYTDNSIIYHGQRFGNGKCYFCTQCGVSCGVHGNPATRRPLGVLATPEMKKLKQQCHFKFDLVWRNCELDRSACYRRLAKLMNIDAEQCHFGWFDLRDLKRANAILNHKEWYRTEDVK